MAANVEGAPPIAAPSLAIAAALLYVLSAVESKGVCAAGGYVAVAWALYALGASLFSLYSSPPLGYSSCPRLP
ncbi:MAG: hypothetical protein TU35_009010 [Thermoproteus sp. AZ2]|uniref:Uncharacterized protein n=1 Tax=Thermoproteus sp. AZ2 TaxID=1609232 RepID=A0ACC6V2Q9_9CREN